MLIRRSTLLVGAAALSLLIQTACRGDPVAAKFFAEGRPMTVQEFERRPIEEQWPLYLYAMQEIHPPKFGFAVPLATRGDQAVVYILRELETSNKDRDFVDAMPVFIEIQKRGYYDICSDTEKMELIQANVARIQAADWRDVYQGLLVSLCGNE